MYVFFHQALLNFASKTMKKHYHNLFLLHFAVFSLPKKVSYHNQYGQEYYLNIFLVIFRWQNLRPKPKTIVFWVHFISLKNLNRS